MTRNLTIIAMGMLLAGVLIGCNAQEKWTYTVKQGERTFADVSRSVTGKGDYAADIAKANPAIKESELKPGTQLTIPEMKDAQGAPVKPMGCQRKDVY